MNVSRPCSIMYAQFYMYFAPSPCGASAPIAIWVSCGSAVCTSGVVVLTSYVSGSVWQPLWTVFGVFDRLDLSESSGVLVMAVCRISA